MEFYSDLWMQLKYHTAEPAGLNFICPETEVLNFYLSQVVLNFLMTACFLRKKNWFNL